jgi:cytochrome c oxidase subunit 2
MLHIRLLPDTASTTASRTDALFWFLVAVAVFFTTLVFILVVYFGLKYRRRSAAVPPPVHSSTALEMFFIGSLLALAMLLFFWGARIYTYIYRIPKDAIEVFVVGKQWMWKIKHSNGAREINELHVPLNRPVKLLISSQDVIHSFFIPDFRIKQDAVPGRYTATWFQATKLGTYHLFCAQYCGTAHSHMVGQVIVMKPEDYEAWLAGAPVTENPAQAGLKLFSSLGCVACHGQVAPTLAGLYGSQVKLSDGRTVTADEDYLRESILDSTAKIVAGYPPIMPSFRGQLSEEQLMDLIAYIRSLTKPEQQRKTQ